MIGALRESHPGTLANLVQPFTDLSVPNTPPSAREAEHAAESLRLQGFQTPTWAALVDGAEAGPFAGDDDPSPKVRRGWQRSAGAAVDKRVFEVLFAELDSASRALLLSQSGAGASCALTVLPTGPDFVVPSEEFRVLLLRRLRLALPLAPRRCQCGRRLDSLGDHRFACAQVGVLAHRVPGSPQVSPCEN